MPTESSGSVRVFYPRYRREELIAELQCQLRSLTEVLPVRRAILFGSWASGRATAFSDIDLLIVYADPPRDDAYRIVRRSFKLRGIEPHVYSEGEARQLQDTLRRMTLDGIDLL